MRKTDAAQAAGITGYYRTAALNSHPLFIEALASLVIGHIEPVESDDDRWHAKAAQFRSEGAERLPALID